MACEDQITSQDLENAKDDSITIAEIATSRAGGVSGGALIDDATTRLGDTVSTLRGQLAKLGYQVPVTYASGVSFTVDDAAKTVEESGIVYAPLVSELPFTTSGTWVGDDDARFRVVNQENLSGQVTTNTANIATNTANIATNTGNIATNTADIAANTAAIAALDGVLVHSVDVITTSSQSTTAETPVDITGLSLSITPQSASSKFLLMAVWNGEGSNSSNFDCVFGFRRDSTAIGNPAASGNRRVGRGVLSQGSWESDASSTMDSWSGQYLDEPNTTSEITYTVFYDSRFTQTLYNNRSVADSDTTGHERTTSSLIALEFV